MPAAQVKERGQGRQVNAYMQFHYVEMLDAIVKDECLSRPAKRSDIVAALIAKEFRRRKLKLVND